MSNEDSPATGSRLDARMLTHWEGSAILQRAVPGGRLTAGCPSGQRERSVKPSAQPTLVRTQHLPHKRKQAPDQHVCGQGLVSSCAAVGGAGRADAACIVAMPVTTRDPRPMNALA